MSPGDSRVLPLKVTPQEIQQQPATKFSKNKNKKKHPAGNNPTHPWARRGRQDLTSDRISEQTSQVPCSPEQNAPGDLLLKVTVLHIAKEALQFRYSTYQQFDQAKIPHTDTHRHTNAKEGTRLCTTDAQISKKLHSTTHPPPTPPTPLNPQKVRLGHTCHLLHTHTRYKCIIII